MYNPFIKNNSLQYEASINRTVLLDIGHLTGGKTIEGKTAAEVFSIDAIIEEIKDQSAGLQIDLNSGSDRELPIHLNRCLESANNIVKQTAEQIADRFGERLGIILFKIKRGKSKSEKERRDWPAEGWLFWQQIDNVILSGGLASGRLGMILKENIHRVFAKGGIKPYSILLTKDSSLAGLTGAAMFIEEKAKANLVFDFGQSFLKRGIAFFDGNVLTGINALPKILSKFMDWSTDEMLDLTHDALKLDSYLQQMIIDTVEEVSKKGIAAGNEISISLANYINNGKIQYRGGYGKLRFISDEYDKYLAREISRKIGKPFEIKIIHDGTAIAANFMELPKAASIALGTSFGIGFPMPELYHKKIGEELNILEGVR